MSRISNFDWWDTPNPTERGFVIEAGEQDQDCEIPDFMNSTVLFSDCPDWITREAQVITALQSYRLIHAEKAGVLRRRFYFARVRTEDERDTPFRAERWIKRMWSWPTVLLKLWAEKGSVPITGVDSAGELQSTDSLLERVRYRKGDTYPTWFRMTEYLSESGFGDQGNRQIVPVTDSIHWSFDGFGGSFPECLHPGVTVPNNLTSGQVLFGFGTPEKGIGADIVRQDYPPTNMQDWEPYPIEDDRKVVLGLMEHRILIEAFPPIDDREIQS